MRRVHLAAILVLLALTLPAAPAHAAGAVTVCDEAHLKTALAGGGTVTFSCSGTVVLTSTITIAANTTIDGAGQTVTISGNHAVRVFVLNSGISLSLNNLMVAYGTVAGTDDGGGILSSGGLLTANNTTFYGNSAGEGGAILSNGGTVIVENSGFYENSAGNYGGGISEHGAKVTITGTNFSDNTSGNGAAGIYADGGRVTVQDSSFHTNTADNFSGAIWQEYGTLTVTNSIFDSNRGGLLGGAIQSGGTTTVSNSTFYNNNAVYGGGLYNDGTGTVTGSTFYGNISTSGGAGHGGAIYNEGATLSVSNSTLYDNTGDNGGGIANEQGAVTVVNSTIAGNSGAGISYLGPSGTTTLKNTIVAGNLPGGNCSGAVADGLGNLTYPDRTCPGINRNPVLGSLQNNGGPTQTMALGVGSAAIDVGNAAACAASPVNNLDQRGVTRPQGAGCDIGAVEQQPAGAPRPPSPWVDIDIKPGSDPNTINCRNANALITVAILTTGSFDATTVDPRTVRFAGAAETHVHKQTGEAIRHVEDVNGDGKADLVFHFRLGSTRLTCESRAGMLWGRTLAGQFIWGIGSVRMVGGG